MLLGLGMIVTLQKIVGYMQNRESVYDTTGGIAVVDSTFLKKYAHFFLSWER
jgi:hypothetical protein